MFSFPVMCCEAIDWLREVAFYLINDTLMGDVTGVLSAERLPGN